MFRPHRAVAIPCGGHTTARSEPHVAGIYKFLYGRPVDAYSSKAAQTAIPSVMLPILEHQSLGKIQGKPGDGIVQYLGIKYAELKDRFAEAVLPRYSKEGTINATKIGPGVLTIPDAVDLEQGLIQQKLPFTDRELSDLHGLGLGVFVPADTKPSDNLPVVVFIHGGGFFIGSSGWPANQLGRLVDLSARKGVPVIGVGINYRTHAPGFLTSTEMRAAGYKANNGLLDQRVALQWIQEHIAGFGGDPSKITIAGESAGAMSVSYHMQSNHQLFSRVMLMSGSDICGAPLPIEVGDHAYSSAAKILGLESMSPEARVSALASMPSEDILKLPPSLPLRPVVDNDTIMHIPTFKSVTDGTAPYPARKWLEGIMIGDCEFDGSIAVFHSSQRKPGVAKLFCGIVQEALPEHASELLQIYDVTPETSDDEGFYAVQRFESDIDFYAPTLAYARGFSDNVKTFVYRFNEQNPWEGPSKGKASHIFDVALLLQNHSEHLSAEQHADAEAFGEAFVRFVAGQDPWQAWKAGSEVAMVIGPQGLALKNDVPAETGRRQAFLTLAEKIGYDPIARAWAKFMQS